MRGWVVCQSRWVAGLVGLAAALGPCAATAQPTATLFFPPGVTGSFGLTDPIPVIVHLAGSPVPTVSGFSQTDLLSLLRITTPGGGVVTAASGHTDIQPKPCAPGSPLLVLPVETLNLPVDQGPTDIRPAYALTQPGTYTATARIPLQVVTSFFTGCPSVPGPVVSVTDSSSFQSLTLVSNGLTFTICCYTFVGFVSPLDDEAICSVSPCLSTRFGRSIPVKFQVFANGTPFRTAVAFISVEQVSGSPPPTPPGDLGGGAVPVNQFVFEEDTQHYHFTLDSRGLAPGVWRIKITLDDGSVHSALVELTP